LSSSQSKLKSIQFNFLYIITLPHLALIIVIYFRLQQLPQKICIVKLFHWKGE